MMLSNLAKFPTTLCDLFVTAELLCVCYKCWKWSTVSLQPRSHFICMSSPYISNIMRLTWTESTVSIPVIMLQRAYW